MSKIMQNLIVLMEPSEDRDDVSLKAGNMILNRYCIDEDAAFELSGVYYLETSSREMMKLESLKSLEFEEKRSVKGKGSFIWVYLRFLFWDTLTISLPKEQFDEKTIVSALQNNSKNVTKELKTHFVYAGHYYYEYDYMPFRRTYFSGRETRLKAIILKGMKKYQLDSIMVTSVNMHRWNLITKERMENYYKGKDWERKHSVNDDLESLFEDILLGKEPDENIDTYFLPKLTEKEVELVERKDRSYFQTFQRSFYPDVGETEMMRSESDSKYVESGCGRRTFTIENSPSNCCNCSLQ